MPDKIAWEISHKLMEGLITEDEALSYCVMSLNEALIEIKKDESFVIHPLLAEQSANRKLLLIANRIQDVAVTLALMTNYLGSDEFEKEWDC